MLNVLGKMISRQSSEKDGPAGINGGDVETVPSLLSWLQERPETCIAVVGHSAFFQIMTGSRQKMRNCGIVEMYVPCPS